MPLPRNRLQVPQSVGGLEGGPDSPGGPEGGPEGIRGGRIDGGDGARSHFTRPGTPSAVSTESRSMMAQKIRCQRGSTSLGLGRGATFAINHTMIEPSTTRCAQIQAQTRCVST